MVALTIQGFQHRFNVPQPRLCRAPRFCGVLQGQNFLLRVQRGFDQVELVLREINFMPLREHRFFFLLVDADMGRAATNTRGGALISL